jgi:RNA polymerase sigma-70 factor (ECF subfamily)
MQSNTKIKSDEILLLELHLGSEEAFISIYDRYHRMMYGMAYRYLKIDYLAEDAVQDVMMRIWEKRMTIEIETSFKSYIFTSLRNNILNQIRSKSFQLEKIYEVSQYEHIFEDDLLEQIENEDFLVKFNNAIESLPEQKKRICKLKLTEKYSNQEIAEMMNISIPTVKTHYTQAIKLLRAVLVKLKYVIALIVINQ